MPEPVWGDGGDVDLEVRDPARCAASRRRTPSPSCRGGKRCTDWACGRKALKVAYVGRAHRPTADRHPPTMDWALRRTAALLAALAISGTAFAQSEVDGDTIRIGAATFRLWGIDASEAKQACSDGWQAGAAVGGRSVASCRPAIGPWHRPGTRRCGRSGGSGNCVRYLTRLMPIEWAFTPRPFLYPLVPPRSAATSRLTCGRLNTGTPCAVRAASVRRGEPWATNWKKFVRLGTAASGELRRSARHQASTCCSGVLRRVVCRP